MSIPKRLHFIWIGDDALRPDACIDSWVERHPDWEIRLWGNDDLGRREWINARHMRTFAAERKWAGVADLMRWEILYDEGGVAIDADSFCMAPLPDEMLENAAFACWENELARPGLIVNGYLGAAPGNPFIGQVVLDLQALDSVAGTQPWMSTGPKKITETYRTHRYADLTIYPSHYFIPRHYGGTVYRGGGRVYADQLWATTSRRYGRIGDSGPRWRPGHGDAVVPFITVGIITYNRADYLREAIESALAQDHPAFEVLVVDDGSTDATEALVASIADPRLRYVRKPHTNLPDTRNRALAEARGEFVCWLDSDDVLLPGTLSHYAQSIRDWPEASVFYGDMIQIDGAGREQRRLPSENLGGKRDLFAMLVTGNRMPNPGTLVNTQVMREIGGYDVALERCEDYDLWLRIAARGEIFRHVGREVVRYRWHGGNVSADGAALRGFELAIMRRLLADHTLDELCSDLGWHDPDRATVLAIARIGMLFRNRGDLDTAVEWLREAKRRGIECGLQGAAIAAAPNPEQAEAALQD